MASPFATEICLDKAKTYDLAREQNVPLPETSTVRNVTDINTQIGKIGFPFHLETQDFW
jgi:hypothetical protein